MKILSIILATLSTYSWAACKYELDPINTQVTWTAYKTPKKAGVVGKFDKFSINYSDASTVEKAIETASVEIDTTSINTGNPERDKKIMGFFFTKKSKPIKISGKVTSLKDGYVTMILNVNGTKNDVPLLTKIEGDKVTMNGVIDVLDFGLAKQLKAINQACLVLHEKKTWSDVALSLTASFVKKCD